jgi:hypothetical protein
LYGLLHPGPLCGHGRCRHGWSGVSRFIVRADKGIFDRIYDAVLGGPLVGLVTSLLMHRLCLLYVTKGDPFPKGAALY